jgi:hypothetical protein
VSKVEIKPGDLNTQLLSELLTMYKKQTENLDQKYNEFQLRLEELVLK